MMHFPLVSEFPLFPKNLSDSVENFPDFTFSEKISDFHPQKFLMTFFSHRLQISKFPPQFRSSPYFGEISHSSLLFKNSPLIS